MENTSELIARLASINGVRFAHLEYSTDIKTAAKFKDVKITKDVSANIQIFGSILDYTNVYRNAIIRSRRFRAKNAKRRPKPPPKAMPLTAAMTGLSRLRG